MRKIAFILFLYIGAITMIIMSFHYFQSNSAGILKRKEIAGQFWYLFTFRAHIFMGLIAILIGPFQFIEMVRERSEPLHKIIGYVYMSCVLFSSLSGLVIAQFAMGGFISVFGFSILSSAWLFTIFMAIYYIKIGNILNHKKWMYFNYSLTFASITQRTLLLIPLLTEIPFIPIYRLSAWLPWILNLGIGYFLFKRSKRNRFLHR